jgi:cellulose synthase/poly-beta-1,6-N-acetylglucosamine synthase-like glycosyltransferase
MFLVYFFVILIFGGVISWLTFQYLPDWEIKGKLFFIFLNLISLFYLGGLFLNLIQIKDNLFQFLLLLLILILTLFSLGLMWLEIFHILNVISRKKWHRIFNPIQQESTDYFPMVSIHIPISNEPPAIVKATLDSISNLDYPNFEVIVVDNNTALQELWMPIRDHCEKLGPKFRFFHEEVMLGAKAEALNYALTKTDPRAQIIGVIDSDHIVHPGFLKATVSYFKNPQVAVVQIPQDWRKDFDPRSFLKSCYLVYRYFFTIMMRSCNEYNASSFMGTLGLVRKKVLEEIKGWNEECVTEDIELGLRIHPLGYSTIYIHQSFGGGVMPFRFRSLRSQRIRWVFGNMQTIRKNFKKLFLPSSLNFLQRISYLAALTIWFNNLFIPTFLLLGIGMAYLFGVSVFPLILWSLATLFFIFLFRKAFAFLFALRLEEKFSFIQSLKALLVFFSLSWVMSMIWFFSLFKTGREGWRLTPKAKVESLLFKDLFGSWEEIGVGIISFILAVAILIFVSESFKWLIVGPLFFLSIVYLSSLWCIFNFFNLKLNG